jgi:uncharacterized protein (DUF58 family)
MTSPLFPESFLRRLERVALLYRRAAAGPLQGERRSALRGQSVEFSDFRPYAAGDDFRRIDWNAYARLERLFIKLFVEEQDTTVHLLIDVSRSMDWGEPHKLTYASRLAGALGYIALVGLDRVTVTALGDGTPPAMRCLPPLRGKPMAISLFSFLQELQPGAERPVTALNAYAANAGFPGPLLLISDLMDDGWQPALSRLAGRGYEITLLHLLSPDETDPELNGDFRLLDSENLAPVEISADYQILQRYRAALSTWQESWRKFCAARQMHYISINTSQPLEEILFAGLPQQGVLK